MPEFTNILELEKPFQDEDYNVDVFNDNAQKLDDYMIPDRVPAEIIVKGRTLVNLLGRAGNAIYQQEPKTNGTATVTFEGDAMKLTSTEVEGFVLRDFAVHAKPNACYIAVSEIKLVTGVDAYTTASVFTGETEYKGPNHVADTVHYRPSYLGIKLGATLSNPHEIGFRAAGPIASSAYFKNVRLYEITQAEYDALDAMTADEIAIKYPYVDDVKPVVNPYIESNENLFTANPNNLLHGAIDGTTGYAYDAITFPEYKHIFTTPSVDIHGIIQSYTLNSNMSLPSGLGLTIQCRSKANIAIHGINTTELPKTFTPPIGTSYLYIMIYSTDLTTDIIPRRNECVELLNSLTLVKGPTPKPYDECHNSRIMFETRLYDGETVSRQNDGQYVKNGEWEEFTDFANMRWTVTPTTGHKTFHTFDKIVTKGTENMIRIGYIGDIITDNTPVVMWGNSGNGALQISLPNTLTGWGDSYTPTSDEIKAFFLGWKMYSGDISAGYISTYNGTGNKWFAKLWCGIGTRSPQDGVYVVAGSHTSTIPTALNDQGYTPYRLIYKKAVPTLEEVRVHGSLDISEESIVNVSSGLVLGEPMNPHYDSSANLYVINNTDYSKCVNRTDIILKSYMDNEVVPLSQSGYHVPTQAIYGGKLWAKTLIRFTLIDYLIYKPDTVTAFDYTITTPEHLKETLNKAVEELSNTNKKLSKVERELARTKYELSQRSNPNLLINGDFIDPVNQRVLTEYTINNKYTIDRWILYRPASVVGDVKKSIGGLTIRATEIQIGSYLGIRQAIEDTKSLLGKTVTISVKVNRNTTSKSKVIIGFGNSPTVMSSLIHGTDLAGTGIFSFTWEVPKNTVYPYLVVCAQMYTDTVGEIEIEWVKLELGEFATPFVPRTYAEELAMCQRYYEVCDLTSARAFIILANSMMARAQFKVVKRVVPTITVSNGLVATTAQGAQTGFTFAASTLRVDNGVITATKTAHGLTDGYIDYGLAVDAEIY